jgi:hypothetical protein
MKKALVLSILLLIGVVFFGFLAHFWSDLPISDDFPMMLLFLDDWQNAASWAERYRLLTVQFTEHRLVFMKQTALAVRAVLGRLDFRGILVVGNALLVVILMLLGAAYGRLARRGSTALGGENQWPLWAFLPAAFVFLQPGSSFEGVLWPASTLSFPVATSLSMGAFYLLLIAPHPVRTALAWILAAWATYSHGNGILALGLGGGALLLFRRWREAGIWWAVTAGFLVLFFATYHVETARPNPLLNVQRDPGYVLGSMMSFIGSVAYFPDVFQTPYTLANLPAVLLGAAYLAFILGLGLLLALNQWVPRFRRAPLVPSVQAALQVPALQFWWLTGLMAALTAMAFGIARTEFAALFGFPARYRLYTFLTTAVVYLLVRGLLPGAARRTWSRAGLLVAVGYWLATYGYQLAHTARAARSYETGLTNWYQTGTWHLYGYSRAFNYEGGINEYSNRVLRPRRSAHYQYPAPVLLADSALRPVAAVPGIRAEVTQNEHGVRVRLSGPGLTLPAWADRTEGYYIVVQSPTHRYLYPTFQYPNGLGTFLTTFRYYDTRAEATLEKGFLPPGTYEVLIYGKRPAGTFLLQTPVRFTQTAPAWTLENPPPPPHPLP